MKKTAAGQQIEIIAQPYITTQFVVIGESPLIVHSFSAKARQELLLPPKAKNRAAKETTLKHDPYAEFGNCIYRMPANSPTFIGMPSAAFKRALSTAALDTPGATKSQIGRLCYIEGELVPVFGLPRMFMAMVRSSDINRTPDVRTRAIIPEWCAKFDVSHSSALSPKAIVTLMDAAGKTCGVGDWRPEKGSGSYGRFRVATENDFETIDRLTTSAGWAAQDDAMGAPVPYDTNTAELLTWFAGQVQSRGIGEIA